METWIHNVFLNGIFNWFWSCRYIGPLNPAFHRYGDRVASVIELYVCLWVLCVFICYIFSNPKAGPCHCRIFVILKPAPASSVSPPQYTWKLGMGMIVTKVWQGKYVTHTAQIQNNVPIWLLYSTSLNDTEIHQDLIGPSFLIRELINT